MAVEVICFTDGSACIKGDYAGVGGFGTFFPDLFGKKIAFSAGYSDAKVGMMEVLALLHAIEAMPLNRTESLVLTVYSDSEYVVKTFTEKRLEKWKNAGWKNTSGEVANKKLWIDIDSGLMKRKYLSLNMKHIKSHQIEKEKDPIKKETLKKDFYIRGNLIVDRLADYKRHAVLLDSKTIL